MLKVALKTQIALNIQTATFKPALLLEQLSHGFMSFVESVDYDATTQLEKNKQTKTKTKQKQK